MNVAVPAVTAGILAVPQLAWLNVWPLKQIFTWLIGLLGQQISIFFQVAGIKLIVTIQTDAEQGVYTQAEGNLRNALLTGDKDAIAKASKEADAAFESLIHYDGSSPVKS